ASTGTTWTRSQSSRRARRRRSRSPGPSVTRSTRGRASVRARAEAHHEGSSAMASTTTARWGPVRKRPSRAVVSRARVTVGEGSRADLAHDAVEAAAGPRVEAHVRRGPVGPAGRDDQAAGGQVVDGRGLVTGVEGAQLRHRAPARGHHDALAALS